MHPSPLMRSDYGLLPGAIVTMRTFVITVTAVGREPVQTGLGGGAYLMLAKAGEYRAMAITCERLAKKTRDPYSKSVLVRSARKWRALEDAPRGTMSIARSRAPRSGRGPSGGRGNR